MADEQNQGPADSPADDDPSSPLDHVDGATHAALKAERDELYDRVLRKTAEFDNYRRRVERERREQADQSVNDLLLDLLSVVDDFDLARGVETTDASYKKGIELIYSKLNDLLRRHGVKPLEAVGKDFDPNVHEAVAHEASRSHRDGEVIAELRRGYLRGERLLRPAMVKVAKA
jgi:molecular chaperone GrpE